MIKGDKEGHIKRITRCGRKPLQELHPSRTLSGEAYSRLLGLLVCTAQPKGGTAPLEGDNRTASEQMRWLYALSLPGG